MTQAELSIVLLLVGLAVVGLAGGWLRQRREVEMRRLLWMRNHERGE